MDNFGDKIREWMTAFENLIDTHDDLWHQEQKVRDFYDNAEVAAGCKRAIDKLNQQRHDLKEKMMSALKFFMSNRPIENPQVIYKPSILANFSDLMEAFVLAKDKLYHIKERIQNLGKEDPSDLIDHCARIEDGLRRRIELLKMEIQDMLVDLVNGAIEVAERPELKMYNNPQLNK